MGRGKVSSFEAPLCEIKSDTLYNLKAPNQTLYLTDCDILSKHT